MIMRKASNENQFGFDFGQKTPPKETKSSPMPNAREVHNLYSKPPATTEPVLEQDDDRDEDPRAQAAREWREARQKRA